MKHRNKIHIEIVTIYNQIVHYFVDLIQINSNLTVLEKFSLLKMNFPIKILVDEQSIKQIKITKFDDSYNESDL